MKKLSILSPLKITNQKQFDLFNRCLKSYKNIIQNNDVEFLVVNESSVQFKNEIENVISEIKPEFKTIEEKGFVNSVRTLIKKSTGKYVMFFLDDVEMVIDSEKICLAVLKSMEINEDIFQVKLGGGKVSNTPKTNNLNKFSNTHKKIKINDEFNIWINQTKNEYYVNEYVISQWNSIMRGGVIRDLNDRMGINLGNSSWDYFTVIMSRKYKDEIGVTYTGWVNLRSFLYPWGRSPHQINKWMRLVSS
jgi:hypothetical protein